MGLEFGWKTVFPFDWKHGPGVAVEPTVRNRKVAGSNLSLCTFVRVRLGTITILSRLRTVRALSRPILQSSAGPGQAGAPTLRPMFF